MRLNDANIYPGIRPFDKEDAQYYFGRDIQIEELKVRLLTSNFLAIIGSSGTGKSSLVRAGLIPRLEKDGSWRISVSRPENSPIANLATALNKNHVFGNLGEVYETKYTRINLDYSSRGIIDTLKQSKYEGKLLLVIDQFEEIFRFKDQKENRDESMRFINLLLTAAHEATSKVYIIITMRSEFLGRCSEFYGLPEKINEGQFLVPRLTRSQYKEAIVRPLEVSSIKVSMSPSLTSRVLNDIQDDPDQLPVLQHALMRTWKLWLDKREKSKATTVIDVDVYEEVGGMETALGKHAHELLVSLGTDHLVTTKKIFQRITEFNSDGWGIRRPIRFGDLVKVTGATDQDVRAVINTYRAEGVNFLVPPPEQELTNETFIDISHESLIRKWVALGEWMKEEQLDKGTLVKLAEDSDDYDHGKASLLSDRQLSGLLKWEKLKDNQFVEWASIYTPDVERKLDFLKRSKRANYRNYILKVAGIPTMLILLLSFAYLYYIGRVEAEKNANEILYKRSKDYDQIKGLVLDSAYRVKQMAALNQTLAEANDRIRDADNTIAKLKSDRNSAGAASQEIAKLNKEIQNTRTSLNSTRIALNEKSDSLRRTETRLRELRNAYNSIVIERDELKAQRSVKSDDKESIDPEFGGLSGAPIWLYFSTPVDSAYGSKAMEEIRKDIKGINVSLISTSTRIDDISLKDTVLPKGIYAVGPITERIAIDIAILHIQLSRKDLKSFKIDTQTLEKKQAMYRSTKRNSGLVVLLSDPQQKDNQQQKRKY